MYSLYFKFLFYLIHRISFLPLLLTLDADVTSESPQCGINIS